MVVEINKYWFQSFILTNLDAYQLQLNSMNELLANVSTFRLSTSVEDKWVDINMQSEDIIKVKAQSKVLL